MGTATTRDSQGRSPKGAVASAAEPFELPRGARIPGRPSVSRRTAFGLLGLLALVGLGIRLAIPRGLWLDEAISLQQAKLGLPELIQDLAQTDRHPPLHHAVLWVTTRVFGDGDLTIRAPSVVAGVLLIAVVYWLGAEVFDRRTGLVAALLTTVAPILVWYSQEARGYALEALFCTLTVVGCVRVIKYGRARDWALHAAAAALAVWTHWFAILIVLATEAILLWELLRQRRAGAPTRAYATRWALASAVLLAQLVPLGMLAAEQLRATGTAGGYAGASSSADAVSFYTLVSNVAWALFGFHPENVTELLAALWPLFMLSALLLLGRGLGRGSGVLLACAIAPVVALICVGLYSADVFEVRYFVFTVPVALVLFARLALTWPSRALGRTLVVAVMTAVLLVALVDQQRNDRNPRLYDMREALSRAEQRAGSEGVVLYQPSELRYVIDHYAPALNARPLGQAPPAQAQARRVVVLASFLDQARYRAPTDRLVGALRATRREGPRDRFAGVRLWSFR